MNNFKKVAMLSISTLLLFSCTDKTKSETTPSSSSSSIHEHTYADSWSHDGNKHWYDDTCGHKTKKDEGNHTFDEGKETEEGTEFTCTVCGYAKTETSKYRVTEKEWDDAFGSMKSLRADFKQDGMEGFLEIDEKAMRMSYSSSEDGSYEVILANEDGTWNTYTRTGDSETYIKEAESAQEGYMNQQIKSLSFEGYYSSFTYSLETKQYCFPTDSYRYVDMGKMKNAKASFLSKELQSYSFDLENSGSYSAHYEITGINSTEVYVPTGDKIHTHTYSKEWKSDFSYHWQEDTCGHGTKINKGEHDFESVVTKPTYEEGGYTTYTCKVCGCSYKDNLTDKLTHWYSNTWSNDENNHWHACLDEGYEDLRQDVATHDFQDVVTEATYEEEGYTTHTCRVCGYSYVDSHVDKLEHNFSSEWESDYSTHWHKCEDTGYSTLRGDEAKHTYKEEVIDPTYEESGYTLHTCTVCGRSYESDYTGKLEHTYSDKLTWDENEHWYACLDKGYEDLKYCKESHKIITKQHYVTYDSEGYTEDTCYCGYSRKYDIVDQLVHTYYDTWSNDENTHWHACKDYGYYSLRGDEAKHEFNKTGECIICGYNKGSKNLEFASYSYVSKTVKGLGSEESKDIIIPSKLYDYDIVSISNNAFKGTDIRSIIIPDSIESIGENAFYGCESLEYVYIGSGCTQIGDNAFYGCKSLKNIEISENNKVYDSRNNCNAIIETETSELKVGSGNTVIPEGILTIGRNAFRYLNTIENVSIPDSVTTISGNAFYSCSSLKTVTLGSGVKTIGGSAFTECTALETISLNDNIESIGTYAFSGCTSLTSIDLPDALNYVAETLFSGCTSLSSVNLGENITGIGMHAFYKCSSLTSIDLSKGVETIGIEAFLGCTSLKDVSFSNVLTDINFGAFHYCSSLTSINLPDSLTYIDRYAFSGCKLISSINIPKSVKTVGIGAFTSCDSLTEITVDSENETFYSENNAILSKDKYGYVTLQVGCRTTTISEGVNTIGESAFSGHDVPSSLTLPDSVYTIEANAFSSCYSLESIYISKNVRTIDGNPFAYCNSLSEIKVDSNNNYFSSRDSYSKHECNVIVNVHNSSDAYVVTGCKNSTIPSNVITIYDSAFSGCTSLTSIRIPASVVRIGNYAFKGCTSLESIQLPSTLKSIGDGAFSNCKSLTDVELPEGLEVVGGNAFSSCTSLTSVYIPSTVYSIKSSAFYNCESVKFFYKGTSEDMAKFSGVGIDREKVYYYSETEPQTEGNYWHYVDEKRVIW